MINRDHFFRSVRSSLFAGRFTQSQVDGLNALLDIWDDADPRHTAYALATAYHEVSQTMQPIKEYGGAAYFFRMYDIEGSRPHVARTLGNTQPGDGAKFAGRGYVQLTGRTNYERASEVVGDNLVANPDLAMKPEYAAKIMYDGMTKGWYTGKKLSDYIKGSVADYYGARRIINGLDKAADIAGYARKFEAAIQSEVLRMGAAGDLVAEAQILLNKKGAKPPLKVDRDFGPRTHAAVLALFPNSGGAITAEVWKELRS